MKHHLTEPVGQGDFCRSSTFLSRPENRNCEPGPEIIGVNRGNSSQINMLQRETKNQKNHLQLL